MKKAKKTRVKVVNRTETNADDFAIFVAASEEYLAYFGLLDWKVVYSHEDYEGALAWWESGPTANRCVRIGLSVDWGQEIVTEKQVCKSAFHEVCELLLASLADKACKYFNWTIVEEDTHAVIRRLENSVFETLWEER